MRFCDVDVTGAVVVAVAFLLSISITHFVDELFAMPFLFLALLTFHNFFLSVDHFSLSASFIVLR